MEEKWKFVPQPAFCYLYFVSEPTDVRKLSHDEITEPTPSDLTPKTLFSLEQKNKYSPLAKTDAETTGKLNFDPKTNQNIRIDNGTKPIATQQIIENSMPTQPQTLSMLSKALTNQKPMTLKLLQTTKKTKVPLSY